MEKILKENKKAEFQKAIFYQAKLHWVSYVIPSLYIIVGSLGILPLFIMRGTFQIIALLLVILFCKGILQIWQLRNTTIYIKEGYVSISTGIFSKKIFDLSLKKIEGIKFTQNQFEKLLNYGSLLITTGEISFKYRIFDPSSFRQIIINQNNE